MKMQTFLISGINPLVVNLGLIDPEDFELMREEELGCCEAYARRAASDYGDFSEPGAINLVAGRERGGGIVVGEGHFVRTFVLAGSGVNASEGVGCSRKKSRE
jgi:hypothetical protein